MTIRDTQAKSMLWFGAILCLVFAFPLQVFAGSPLPSLLPYCLFTVIVVLSQVKTSPTLTIAHPTQRNRRINQMVCFYVIFLILHTVWHIVSASIDLAEAASILIVYLLPVSFYWYFRSLASEQEIRLVLFAVVVAGLVVGIYFAYDSYLKLALGEISDYANAAFQYSVERAPRTLGEPNDARVNLGSRSSGLLQSHTVSGAWVAIGAFATLALLPPDRRLLRRILQIVFGVLLILGLNFSSIIAFILVIMLMEFYQIAARYRRRPLRQLGRLIAFSLSLLLTVGSVFWLADDLMSENILTIASIQKDILFSAEPGNKSMFGLAVDTAISYLRYIERSPLTLIVGDGFSSSGFEKGGDIGALETLAQFGLLFYFAILIGVFGLIKAGLNKMKSLGGRFAKDRTEWQQSQIIQFAISITLLVAIMDCHYSVWSAKSIMPILFFVLALFGRYLSGPTSAN